MATCKNNNVKKLESYNKTKKATRKPDQINRKIKSLTKKKYNQLFG